MIDEQLARRLLRQIKVLNFLIIFFAVVFMAIFAVAGVFAYAAVQEVKDAKDSLTSVQQKATDSLNVRDDLCSSSGTVSTLLKNQSELCN